MNLPQQVLSAISKIENAGFEAYAVGGCVRDSLMGKTPVDWDLTTSAPLEDMLYIFSDSKVIPTGIKHGTLTVIQDGLPMEITTYRIDGKYTDNRHPANVTFSAKLSDDLMRRDFTVNAMAYSVSTGLVDLYEGTSDLKNGIIRAVGDPETRFAEDALRIMRAIRFAATLGFKIEDSTSNALIKCSPLLKNIASERIATELNKTLTAEKPASILTQYFPAMAQRLFGKDISSQATTNNFGSLNRAENNLVVRLSLFLLGSSRIYNLSAYALAKELLTGLKYDNHTSQQVLLCLKNADLPLTENKVFLRKLFYRLGPDTVHQILQIKSALSDNPEEFNGIISTVQAIICDGDCCHIENLAVKGSDLISAFGLEGRQIGKALDFLVNAVMEDRCENKRDTLIEYLKQNPQ